MSKQKKKRNKAYQGRDAKQHTQIVRVTAVKRSALGQWWLERKRFARPVIIAFVVAFIVTWLIVELIRVVF